jgi:hypothetical protein
MKRIKCMVLQGWCCRDQATRRPRIPSWFSWTSTDRAQTDGRIEGLPQVAGGSGLLDPLDGRGVVVGGHEYDRNGQAPLEIEPVHLVHLDIQHEAGRSVPRQPVEELSGGGE